MCKPWIPVAASLKIQQQYTVANMRVYKQQVEMTTSYVCTSSQTHYEYQCILYVSGIKQNWYQQFYHQCNVDTLCGNYFFF